MRTRSRRKVHRNYAKFRKVKITNSESPVTSDVSQKHFVPTARSKYPILNLTEAAWCQSQLSLRRGGDVVLRHNQLRDVFVDICHKANLGVRIEAGSALTPDLSRSRPADALVTNWIGGSSAAFDVTVTSPLTPVSLHESNVMAGTAALLAEQRKHQANDPKCDTLGWKCIPLAVESYGNWGFEARQAFSHLASHLSFSIGHQKSKLLVDIYGRLNVTLRSHPTEDSCSISPDQVEIQSAIHLKMDFGRHLEVVSLEATEEILAVASVPQAP
ncbi:hypothetical protein EMCRGX_G035014 [Ephydatia muelleri]